MPDFHHGQWHETHPEESFARIPENIAKFLSVRRREKIVIFAENDYLANRPTGRRQR